jgi:hypothetical protein
MDMDVDSDSDSTATGVALHGSPVRQTGRQKRPTLKAAEEKEKRRDQGGSS